MKENKLKLITVFLIILVICLVSFVGVYVQENNRMENKVKGYEFSQNLSGYRELVFELSDAVEVIDSEGKVVGSTDDYTDSTIQTNSYQKTENKINSDESKKEENYKKSKDIIEERLALLGVQEYNLSIDNNTGKMYLQIPENEDTDHTISNILQVSKFEIKDSEDTSNVFITNDNIKKASAVYNSTTSGTQVYLQIEFNKEGKQKIKELSTGEYATKPEEEQEENVDEPEENENEVEAEAEVSSTEENTTNEENSEESNEEEKEDTQKKIILSIDNNEMLTTSFDDPIEDGILNLSMSQPTTDQESISDSLQSTSTISLLLNSGKLPLTYSITSNHYVKTGFSEQTIKTISIIVGTVIALALIYVIVKFKYRGLIAAIAYIGFIALYLLLVRYTNVAVSIESIIALVLIALLNYGLTERLVKIKEKDKEIRKKTYSKEFKNTILKLIPIFIISIFFSFVRWVSISTFGMFMFWGILLIVIYNYLLTKNILD